VIVVNDNARSYSPTIGGLAHHLSTLRTTHGYEKFMKWGKRVLHRTPVVGEPIYGALHGMKKGVKDVVAPQGLFEDLGLKYIGPIDGHDTVEVEHALRRARDFPGPVVVHVITEKGRGYAPAEQDEADRFMGHEMLARDPSGEDGDQQGRQSARDRVDVAEIAMSIGAQQEHVIEYVDRYRAQKPRPRLRARHVHEGQRGEAHEGADQHHQAERHQSVGVGFDDCVPRRVDQRRNEDEPRDRRVDPQHPGVSGAGRAARGMTAPR
jgi:hypothetical protein